MVEHCSANAEAIGSNPVEALTINPKFLRVYLHMALTAITTATIISSFKICISAVRVIFMILELPLP